MCKIFCFSFLLLFVWFIKNGRVSVLSCCSLKEGEEQKEVSIEPAQALDEVEPLPEDYYTRPVNLTEGASLSLSFSFTHFFNLN